MCSDSFPWARTSFRRCKGTTSEDRSCIEDLVLFVLYQNHREGFDRAMQEALRGRTLSSLAPLYEAFCADARGWNETLGIEWDDEILAHIFAIFFQIRRAFANIFQWIIGVSEPAAVLRAQVWHSIFTHDLRRYRTTLFERMADFTTLVGGPSGTGKELVARAIGLSRYVPFDAKTRSFRFDFAGSFASSRAAASVASQELSHLVAFLGTRLMGEEAEALTKEVLEWIRDGLGGDYDWPGNVRELDQCVRNVLVRGEYHPARGEGGEGDTGPWHSFTRRMQRGEMGAEQVLSGYCSWVYRLEGTYEGAARVLGLDRRTVKAKIDVGLF